MRRRRLTVIACSLGLLFAAPVGNASLETDCYVAGGYFDATYMAADYLDETCSTDPPSPPGNPANTLPKPVMNGARM